MKELRTFVPLETPRRAREQLYTRALRTRVTAITEMPKVGGLQPSGRKNPYFPQVIYTTQFASVIRTLLG